MARVTVEDCLDNVDNRFQLVLVATKRARQIANGKQPMVELENDKPTVVALREISEGYITRDILDEREERAEVEEVVIAKEEEQADIQPSDEIVEASSETPVLRDENE